MLQFVNNYRGIAILLVIMVHSFPISYEEESLAMQLARDVFDNITILFVMIAGYLFSALAKDFEYKSFLKNKFLYVILPYIFTTFPAALALIVKIKFNHWWIDMDWFYGDLNVVQQYLYLLIYGAHLGPLWFIPMIVIFYIISPVLVLLKERNLLLYAFGISLIAAVYLGRPEHNENPFQAFAYFLPTYLFGMLLYKNTNWYEAAAKYSLLIFSVFIASLCVLYANLEDVSTSLDLPLKLILAFIVLALCKQYANKKIKILDMFARLSFYLFFVHGYFTGVKRLIYRNVEIPFDGFVAVGIWSVFVILLSLLGFVIGKLIIDKVLGKKYSKYIMTV